MEILTGGNSFPGETGGVGAVVFDKPSISPLEVQKKVLDDLEEYQRRKAAENAKKRELSQALVKDIKLNPDGALYAHQPMLRQKMQGISDAYSDILARYNGDLSSPVAQQEFNSKVRLPSMQFQSEVAASKDFGKLMMEAQNKYDANPDKYDDVSLKNLADARMLSLDDLAKKPLTEGSLLVPKKPSFQDELDKDVKEWKLDKSFEKDAMGKPKLTTVADGRQGIVETEGFNPERINQLTDITFNSPKKYESAARDLEHIKDKSPNFYNQIVEEANKEGVDPVRKFIQKSIEARNPDRKELQNLFLSPYARKKQEMAATDEEKVKDARLLYEKMKGVYAGAKEAYNTVGAGSIVNDPVLGAVNPAAHTSDKLQGVSLGKYSIPYYDNKNQLTYKQGENHVLDNAFIDGKPVIKTEESLIKLSQQKYKLAQLAKNGKTDAEKIAAKDALDRLGADPLAGYEPMTEEHFRRAFTAQYGKDADKLLRKLYTSDNGVYNGVVAKPEKGVSTNVERVNENKTTPNQTASKAKSYTIKGKTYSEAAVANAAKASNMTIDEYLKEVSK